MTKTTYCGTVSIAGRPNVGKSTLLNRLVGQKISITAHKPQTTRHRILGIATSDTHQVIYVDTPGVHVDARRALNQVLNRTAAAALSNVDLVLQVVQAGVWNQDDQRAFELASQSGSAFLIVVNKIDRLENRHDLLPYLAKLPMTPEPEAVLPVSARTGEGVETLTEAVHRQLPPADFQYDADELTDRSMRFLAAEAVREQLTRQLSAELPYALTVEIELFEESPALYRIGAVIWVERASQKGIVIGKRGERLKQVGQRARHSLQNLFGLKVHLELWVRVKTGWADDERALHSLGYDVR